MACAALDVSARFPAEFDVEFRSSCHGIRAVDFFSLESSKLLLDGDGDIESFCSPCIPRECLSSCAAFMGSMLRKQNSSGTAAATTHRTASSGGAYTVHVHMMLISESTPCRTLWRTVAKAHVTLLNASPGQAFSRRIARLIALKRLLLHTNAAISTLGGGHFLCGHLDAASAMAHGQLAVAKALGDDILFARVYMHYVYINLHSGNLDDALRIALRLRRHAQSSKDTELLGMATAAAVLVRRLLALDHEALPEAATEMHAHDGAVVTKASDDFARYRSALSQRRHAGKSPRPT